MTAQEKAMALLRKCLSAQQRLELDSKGTITVKGSLGGTYVIHTSSAIQNVVELNAGTGTAGRWGMPVAPGQRVWCIYLPSAPPADTWLAQKLLLETDEGVFRRIGIGYPGIVPHWMAPRAGWAPRY